jgi:nitrite reductase/ring-hydroxylating ferredoxin subunit
MREKHPRRAGLHSQQEPERKAQPVASPARYRIGNAHDLKRGASIKFLMPIRGIEEECFAINYHGRLYAYVNRCRHIPMAMDWVDNQFFAERGRYLMCQTHNAYYEPETGECIAGPRGACGKFLYRIPLLVEDGVIYADAPDYDFEDDY